MLQPPVLGYVMELITGMVPLQRLMTPPAGAPVAEWYLQGGGLRRRLQLLARLAELLARLHGMGLVYADPSPRNTFVSEDVRHTELGSSTPTTSTPPAARAPPPSTRPAMARPSSSAAMAPSTPSPMPTMPSRCSSSRR